MVKINLIGKKRRESKKRNWIVVTILGLFVAFVIYFLGSVIYVVVKLWVINSEQKKISDESVQISQEMTRDNKLLQNFILSKYILGKMETLNKERFPYKSYLDQLVSFMPGGVVLKNVDFANKGWISVTTSIPGLLPLKQLETRLHDANLISTSAFSSIFSEGVSKEKNGLYSARLQFELLKNGTK